MTLAIGQQLLQGVYHLPHQNALREIVANIAINDDNPNVHTFIFTPRLAVVLEKMQ